MSEYQNFLIVSPRMENMKPVLKGAGLVCGVQTHVKPNDY